MADQLAGHGCSGYRSSNRTYEIACSASPAVLVPLLLFLLEELTR